MFELNGESYTLEALQDSAKSQGVDFKNFMDIMKVKGLTEKSNNFTMADASSIASGTALQESTFSITNKDGFTSVYYGDEARIIENKLVYNNQLTDPAIIAEYNENKFGQWVADILPNSNVFTEDNGLFWDDMSFVKLPGRESMNVDLQPMNEKSKKVVEAQIQEIIDPILGVNFINRNGKELLSVGFENHPKLNGYYDGVMFNQPKFEEILRKNASKYNNIELKLGWQVEKLDSKIDTNILEITNKATNQTESLIGFISICCSCAGI